MHDLNKRSSNFAAEQVLRTLGAEVVGRPGTWDKGLEAVGRYLDSLGIPRNSYRMSNGAGLYDSNRFTPEQLVTVMRAALRDFRIASEYLSSLAVAGIDGTLGGRMGGTVAHRFVRAKTGTLLNVSSLSGRGRGARARSRCCSRSWPTTWSTPSPPARRRTGPPRPWCCTSTPPRRPPRRPRASPRRSPRSRRLTARGAGTPSYCLAAASLAASVDATVDLAAFFYQDGARPMTTPPPTSAPPRQTPLYEAHRRLGAKLIDFGGWMMPVSYPAGIVEEHKATRTAVGIFDVSHMGEVHFRGPGAAAAVQRLVPTTWAS